MAQKRLRACIYDRFCLISLLDMSLYGSTTMVAIVAPSDSHSTTQGAVSSSSGPSLPLTAAPTAEPGLIPGVSHHSEEKMYFRLL